MTNVACVRQWSLSMKVFFHMWLSALSNVLCHRFKRTIDVFVFAVRWRLDLGYKGSSDSSSVELRVLFALFLAAPLFQVMHIDGESILNQIVTLRMGIDS